MGLGFKGYASRGSGFEGGSIQLKPRSLHVLFCLKLVFYVCRQSLARGSINHTIYHTGNTVTAAVSGEAVAALASYINGAPNKGSKLLEPG